MLERLRLVDGEPVSFQASYLPAALGAEVSRADLAVTPLRQVLTFKLGIEITAARETVSAVPLDRRAARELGCRPGIAAFRSDRVSVGADGTPIVYDRVFIPGDRFRITRNLKYDTTTATSNDAPTGHTRSNRHGSKNHGSHRLTRGRSDERRRREEAQPPNRNLPRSTTMKELQGMKGPRA